MTFWMNRRLNWMSMWILSKKYLEHVCWNMLHGFPGGELKYSAKERERLELRRSCEENWIKFNKNSEIIYLYDLLCIKMWDKFNITFRIKLSKSSSLNGKHLGWNFMTVNQFYRAGHNFWGKNDIICLLSLFYTT